MAKFKVLRQHRGDKSYAPGDTREAKESEVQHLVDRGVLEPVREKAEPKAKNKAEPKPKNKAGG